MTPLTPEARLSESEKRLRARCEREGGYCNGCGAGEGRTACFTCDARNVLDDLARTREEIDAAWEGIERGWDIESRAELEAQSKTNGFKFGLAQAVHHMWKRDRKVEGLTASLASATAETERLKAVAVHMRAADEALDGKTLALIANPEIAKKVVRLKKWSQDACVSIEARALALVTGTEKESSRQ